MKSFATLSSLLLALAPSALATTPQPGQTVDLMFINITAQPLTGTVMQSRLDGRDITYYVSCAPSAGDSCTVLDATITTVEGESYTFSEGNNAGGSLTIHCAYAADGHAPGMCTQTVAGGPTGSRITTHTPGEGQWSYLPVKITKVPQRGGSGTLDVLPTGSGSSTEASVTPSSVGGSKSLVQDGAAGQLVAGSLRVVAVAGLVVAGVQLLAFGA